VKVATFRVGGKRRVGLVEPNAGVVRPFAFEPELAVRGALAVIACGGAGRALPETEAPVALDAVTLEAPIPQPRRNIFCVGKNYFDHAHEFSSSGFDSSAASGAVPEVPIIFSKVPESVIGPGAPIRFDPGVSAAIDYEVELAVVIGREGRAIAKASALSHVWGYTIVNDVTARDVQGRHKQWLLGKSFDSFCPMGPWLVSADEVDLADTTVRTWVNGELRQEANTRDLIFDVPTIIECISAGITLRPGDIIATGTPAGVGIGFDPPRYLAGGDSVRLEITGIGFLENPIEEMTAEAAVGGAA
jgi:2-keto-4-pentenoate hydratase/2-oxohepta-3-ene-1,7-dioic acid hydratase in catechol pathway